VVTQVGDGPPAARSARAVHLHVHSRRYRHRDGADTDSRRQRIVQGASPGSEDADIEVEIGVKHLPDRTDGGVGCVQELLPVRLIESVLERDVQAHHREVPGRREDDVSGLRVTPDVRLGSRRAVAWAQRGAAHHGDLRDLVDKCRLALQRHGEVRQRPGGNHPQLT